MSNTCPHCINRKVKKAESFLIVPPEIVPPVPTMKRMGSLLTEHTI